MERQYSRCMLEEMQQNDLLCHLLYSHSLFHALDHRPVRLAGHYSSVRMEADMAHGYTAVAAAVVVVGEEEGEEEERRSPGSS